MHRTGTSAFTAPQPCCSASPSSRGPACRCNACRDRRPRAEANSGYWRVSPNCVRRPRGRCSRRPPHARVTNGSTGSTVRPIETAARREQSPRQREGTRESRGPGSSPSPGTRPTCPKKPARTCPGRGDGRSSCLTGTIGNRCRAGATACRPRYSIHVKCRRMLLKSARTCPDASTGVWNRNGASPRRTEADSTEAVRAAPTVGPPVRERRRRGPSEGAFGPIEKTDGPNQRTAGLLL